MLADTFSPQIIGFLTGAILVASGVLGGGIEIRELKIPQLPMATRALAIVVGIAFIALSLRFAAAPPTQTRTVTEGPTQTFVSPTIDGYRLDWCYNWATDCGATAASAWCRKQGFSKAVEPFEEDLRVGLTKLVGSGEICREHPPDGRCDSFKAITCVK